MNGAQHEVGDMIGPYRLLRQLGEGTAARVFEVEHARIGRRAAMKIVHPDAAVPGLVKRLFVEAQAANLIANRHIVQITDVIEPTPEQPVHALVMELLEGRLLADLLTEQQPLPPARLLPIMAQVCDALAAVHAAGFIHRDLKPENVFLVHRDGSDDFVKLLDFGLVKATRPDLASVRATVEGTFLGSPAYASPEQASGRAVDHRTDIYAVGVMLYELTTGRLPFAGADIGDVLIKQISQPAPHLPDGLLPPELGAALDAIIQNCLAKNPAERMLSAAKLADLFHQLASGVTDGAAKACRPARPRVWLHRRRSPFVMVPVVVGVCAIALFAASAARTNVRPTRPAPRLAPAAALQAAAPTDSSAGAAPAPSCPEVVTKIERASAPTGRRWGRDPARTARAMTLDPYR